MTAPPRITRILPGPRAASVLPFAAKPGSRAVAAIIAAIWVGVAAGFALDLYRHFSSQKPAYLAIVHVHAVVFGAWMVLFTTQFALAAAGRPAVHRRLGRAMVLLVVSMVVLGLATTTLVDRARLLHPGTGDPNFFIIAASDMVAFAGLAGAGLVFRRHRFAHGRLMLLAAIYISDAGFARLAPGVVSPWVHDPFWQCLLISYLFPDLLMGALLVHDFRSSGRIDVVYRMALPLVGALELGSAWLYTRSPTAQEAVRMLLRM